MSIKFRIPISLEKEIAQTAESFLIDLKTRGIPSPGTTLSRFFYKETRDILREFGFSIKNYDPYNRGFDYTYSIEYPNKTKLEIKEFLEILKSQFNKNNY